jgi:long-subunit acyl-CoA synthetase (AMP-forming)
VVPEPEEALKWAAAKGVAAPSVEALLAQPEPAAALAQEVQAQMAAACHAAKLQGFEVVKKVRPEAQLWSPSPNPIPNPNPIPSPNPIPNPNQIPNPKPSNPNPIPSPKQVSLEAELWSVENNLLTPTFKLKRNEAKKKYLSQIDAMYAQGLPPVSRL